MFSTRNTQPEHNMIPATVQFRLDKKKRMLRPLSAEQKMLCALRKALTTMSDSDTHGCRYHIAGKNVMLTQTPSTTKGKEGEPQSYRAAGRCRLGVCHPQGHASTKLVEFAISYRDTLDDRGLPDVEYFDPTTIDELPRDTPLNVGNL